MDELWSGRDFVGRIARQILCPPQTIQNFDTSADMKTLRTENLGPRLCLRPLASYKSLTVIGAALAFGYVVLGAPSYGLFLLLLLCFVVLLINSCFNDFSAV
jgi:sphingomyelin phosphodiesterase 4